MVAEEEERERGEDIKRERDRDREREDSRTLTRRHPRTLPHKTPTHTFSHTLHVHRLSSHSVSGSARDGLVVPRCLPMAGCWL